MNKIFIAILVITTLTFSQDTTAVDTTWQKEAVGSFSASQAHFDNWTAGGENTLAYQLDISGMLVQNTDKFVCIMN